MALICRELGAKTISRLRRHPATRPIAEDLTQEAFEKEWEALTGQRRALDDPESVCAWHWSIVNRTVLDHLRRPNLEELFPDEYCVFDACLDLPSGRAPAPSSAGGGTEPPIDDNVLPELDRLLIDAHFRRGYTNTESAEFLFCSAERIKKRIQRAVARLRAEADASDSRSTQSLCSSKVSPERPSDLPELPHSDRWISCTWPDISPSRHECEARLRRLSLVQQIVVLNRCEGRSSQEIANFLGLDPKQVEPQLAYALHSLRNYKEL
jgi:DNA-directed RNA polymerase specialized sigma24 family protein